MREIKFRAWVPKRKQMGVVDWIELDSPNNMIGVVLSVREDDRLPHYKKVAFEFPLKSVDLRQFTGLKDKSGKEIYEGDIVASKDWVGYQRIEFYGGSFIATKSNRAKKHILHPTMIWKKQLEIVGNIYENPELLKKKDNSHD